MNNFTFGLILVLVFSNGLFIGLNVGNSHAEDKIAKGTLRCEMVRDARVCWNPKERAGNEE